jgi:hypothetical protein
LIDVHTVYKELKDFGEIEPVKFDLFFILYTTREYIYIGGFLGVERTTLIHPVYIKARVRRPGLFSID